VRLGGRVPGERLTRQSRALARPLERLVIREELVDGLREAGNVACFHDAAGAESSHRLGDAADVVGDGRDAGSERAEEGAALIELRPVGKDGDRRLAERAVDLRLREVAEPPVDVEPVRSCAVRLERLERVAGHDETGIAGLPHRLDCIAESLVGPDHSEGEHRPAVVAPLRLAPEHRVGNDAEPFPLDTEAGKRVPTVLGVHDDPVEACEEPPPEPRPPRRPAGEKVVRREDRRQAGVKEDRVELRCGQPLHVEDVRLGAALEVVERGEPEGMLRHLDRHSQRRAAEHAGRDGIEDLAASVADRLRRCAEPKPGGYELDVRSGPRERRCELVVVRRREGRRIGEQDAHGLVRYAVAMLVRTWNLFHGKPSPPGRRAFLREMIELVTRDGPDVVCLQELPVWALPHLEEWSGMHAISSVARRPLLPVGARAVTALHHGLLRSAFTGEADAILTQDPAGDLGRHVVGETKLRRIAHVAEVAGVTVVNFHIDGEREQFDRVLALAPDPSIVAGDANLVSPVAEGFSPPLAGSIDQIYVRGVTLLDGPSAWPVERRVVEGRTLSDHAPVEAVVE